MKVERAQVLVTVRTLKETWEQRIDSERLKWKVTARILKKRWHR
jgi:hypothetical protein